MSRDFIGYGKEKPKIFWPQGNKIAVSFVVNIEEGAELSVSSGDSQNEHVFENNKTKILDIDIDKDTTFTIDIFVVKKVSNLGCTN